MKNLNELTPDEIRALALGEEVTISATRANDFKALSADNIMLISLLPSYMVLSIQRSELKAVASFGRVSSQPGDGPSIALERVESLPSVVEDGQVRVSPLVALELAIGILVNMIPVLPDLVAERVKGNPLLADFLADRD